MSGPLPCTKHEPDIGCHGATSNGSPRSRVMTCDFPVPHGPTGACWSCICVKGPPSINIGIPLQKRSLNVTNRLNWIHSNTIDGLGSINALICSKHSQTQLGMEIQVASLAPPPLNGKRLINAIHTTFSTQTTGLKAAKVIKTRLRCTIHLWGHLP